MGFFTPPPFAYSDTYSFTKVMEYLQKVMEYLQKATEGRQRAQRTQRNVIKIEGNMDIMDIIDNMDWMIGGWEEILLAGE